MSLHSLFAISLLALAHAQTPASAALEPLASKKFTFPNIPYQVTGDQGGIRGPQAGYNICNSTTEGSQSLCQTLFLNSMADFCIWSSSKADDTIGVSEAYEVAWCTKPGHGSRLIPPGAITGAQWLYAKNYLQVVGFIDQSMVNLDPTDMGGELDPHGADEQGNPLGGIVFTNGFGQSASSFGQQVSSNSNGSTSFTQVIEWIDFIGSGIFCLKMCNPNDSNGPQLCNHIYDEIGCNFNALADYGQINGTYEVCDSDDMTPPGVFTTAPGQTTTWFQPQNGPFVPPYTTSIPSSSNCQTFASTQLFVAAATPTATGSAASGSGAGSGSGSGGGTSAAASRSGSGSSPSATSSPGGAVAIGAPVAGLAAALFGAFITLMA